MTETGGDVNCPVLGWEFAGADSRRSPLPLPRRLDPLPQLGLGGKLRHRGITFADRLLLQAPSEEALARIACPVVSCARTALQRQAKI